MTEIEGAVRRGRERRAAREAREAALHAAVANRELQSLRLWAQDEVPLLVEDAVARGMATLWIAEDAAPRASVKLTISALAVVGLRAEWLPEERRYHVALPPPAEPAP